MSAAVVPFGNAVVDFTEIDWAPWGSGVTSVIVGGFLVCLRLWCPHIDSAFVGRGYPEPPPTLLNPWLARQTAAVFHY